MSEISPFGINHGYEPVEKAGNAAVNSFLRTRSMNAHQGSIPRNTSKFKLSDKLKESKQAKQKKRADSIAPYKGFKPQR